MHITQMKMSKPMVTTPPPAMGPITDTSMVDLETATCVIPTVSFLESVVYVAVVVLPLHFNVLLVVVVEERVVVVDLVVVVVTAGIVDGIGAGAGVATAT